MTAPFNPASPAVEARQLVKRYGTTAAVDGVSFQAMRGEIFGFLGSNGAGKTTTLRMLCGLLRPTSGTALIDGIDIQANPLGAKARLGLLDEPTNGLDPRSARLVKDLLEELAARGTTVLLSTHILEVAQALCRRVAIIDRGRLVTMAGALPVIVRAELLAARNRLMKRNPARLAILAITLIVAGVFLGGGAFAIGATAGHFLPFALDTLLAAAFTGLSLLMLVVGFPTVIASLFVGRDLLQLVVAPVRSRDIFVARLMTAVTANLLLSFVLAAGVLGVGAGAGAPWFYFPMALLLIAVQVLVVTALQAILMTVILRWVPAKLARDVAAAVAGLTGAGLYLAWNLNLRKTFGRRGAAPDISNLTSVVQRIDWLPTTWPGHALSATLQGNTASALVWMLAALALAALLVAMAELLYARTLLFGLGVFGGPSVVWRRRKAVPSSRPAPQP